MGLISYFYDSYDIFLFFKDRFLRMANRSQALMLRQFYRTRQRLQRRVPNELIDAAGMIETQLAKQPKYQDERFCNHQNTPLLQVNDKFLARF